ncbi:hypothetical protein L596_010535 [Steinernema carpocapsae]|uniref:Uncharacterized protein n=1 Tax=Steinernema carpocapsae TaxID=34508 RepID=A0A4U5PIM7_STECR|nr:hypothetical protein L596_010535 [Steinernema carpocapsae]
MQKTHLHRNSLQLFLEHTNILHNQSRFPILPGIRQTYECIQLSILVPPEYFLPTNLYKLKYYCISINSKRTYH